ncbi:MAG: ribonuclease HII [Clostridiales bacterium]|nr:ribonuclease HII [Clostridiales bacterium]
MSIYLFDDLLRSNFPVICGVDEAGRGPLAGDVFSAAVILPEGIVIDGLNDSKKITPKKRDELFDIIKDRAISYCVASASVKEIEEMNILRATMLAMERAVDGLSIAPDLVIVDGNQLPSISCEVHNVVKGDSKSASIAAASILAKVSRDRYMVQLHNQYPQYDFDKHKGYGTKRHFEMIMEHGRCDVHRASFLKKLEARNG